MKDYEVVDLFVAHLAANGYLGLKVIRRPDQENRRSQDIDAIANGFAIEHTSIDTLPNQRRNSDWFMRVVGNLADELERKPPFRLKIILEYDAIDKDQNWPAIRVALKTWVEHEALRLPEGRSIIEKSSDIPFRLLVLKSNGRHPGIFFARYEPNDDTLPERIKIKFNEKAEKLAKYQRPGTTTVLLIENDDFALMNDEKIIKAIRTAFPAGPPTGVDIVWYADTSFSNAIEFRNFTPEIWKSTV